MRKIAEIRRDLDNKIAEVKGIDLSNEEASKKGLDELNALVRELNAANEVEAAEQVAAEQKFNNKAEKAGKQFSFVKFVREAAEGKLTGLEADAAEAGAEEYRRLGLSQSGTVIPTFLLRAATGQNYGVAAEGGNLIETMAPRYVEILKEKLAVAKLGATVLTNLIGTVPVITSAQITASWGAEGATAAVSKANFAKASMTPKRNFVQTAVTKDLLRQTSYDVERMLLDLMTEAHANLIEKAAINGSGSANEPRGIINTPNVNSVSVAGGITWPKVVEMETAINAVNANRGKLGYLTNAKVMGAMKTVLKAEGYGRFIYEGDILNGYPVEWTNLVPSTLGDGNDSALIFGNFQDLYIGEWGGLDLVIDPYTKAANGEIVMTINAWNDVLVAEPKSFAVAKDITA